MMGRAHGSFYEMLEVNANATLDEIEASYQRITAYLDEGALAVYSMLDEEEVTALRSGLDEAFRTLSDPDRRTAYDRAMAEGGAHYPPVMVPAAHSGASVSMGHIAPPRAPPAPKEPLPMPSRSLEPVPPAPAARAPPQPGPLAAEPPAQVSSRTPPAPAPRRTRRLIPKLDAPLSGDTEFSGALLRRLRESADATIADVADITKINKRYLRAVEEHDYAALPAAVYVRGFVCEYARALGLEADGVAKSYMAIYQRYKEGT